MIIPVPTDNELTIEQHEPNTHEYVRWYIDCTPWKCPECGSTVFGRCQFCAYCRYVLGKETKRPDSYSG
jgi:predicted RNA-binding Zn-ribbon protein involved in translation (DUF1610 family)